MLSSGYVVLRFIHFSALMLSFGVAFYINRLAPAALQSVMARDFRTLQRICLVLTALSALLMYPLQAGIMGDGWQDVWQPATWFALAGTRFGGVWLWQIVIAVFTLIVAMMRPWLQRNLMLLCAAQLVLMAGVGHAAMLDGLPGLLQRANHAVHLLCASMWFGGLLPVIYCMSLTQRRWQHESVSALMGFSRYGHLAVAGVLITGVVNTIFIQGISWPWSTDWGRMLLIKSALALLMVAIALVNRYVLVPRLSRKPSSAQQTLIFMTWTEVVLGALVLGAVSLFATWEPF
ncbi:copper homeostasis membrane protein CopD [Yokenella regensburgei]|uniref:copper homeostasis membrane protein CopD n=1 Tax=Yokenella regensburgei TaxID=158877 RepID=UPI003F17F46E